MIYPKHHILYKYFFDFYTKRIIAADFKEFKIIGEIDDLSSHSLLVMANHFSWWDGFFHYYLNNLLFKKRYHVMMLEEQLTKRMFLTKLGIFGVRKGTRESLLSLQFAQSLLADKENMVLIFPQGRIESQHQHLFAFEKGINRLCSASAKLAIVMVASFVDYISERKPIAVFYVKKITEREKSGNMEEIYNSFFQASLEEHKRFCLLK